MWEVVEEFGLFGGCGGDRLRNGWREAWYWEGVICVDVGRYLNC